MHLNLDIFPVLNQCYYERTEVASELGVSGHVL